ncbi:MAG: Holliday junction branch migration protein RuvA [Myxococcota bacterium]
MIAQLRGRVMRKDATLVIIDCGGVGYGVSMPVPSLSQLGAEGSEVTVFIHTHVSQDAIRLYGFATLGEQRTFESLIGASGVGPRLALAILSVVSPAELSAIVARGDLASLRRIPGVGPKKAERLLVELRDRLPAPTEDTHGAPVRADLYEDLVSALVNLGFGVPTAQRTSREVLERAHDKTDLATLVRDALRTTSGG